MNEFYSRILWSLDWAQATESFLESPINPQTSAEVRQLATDAMNANDARKLGRFIDPIGDLRREAILKILTSPRHLAKVAEKEKRHAEIYASLPVFDPEKEAYF
jgi:hypothetical protein